jgi:AcrR family transcriptional regulator
VSRREQGKNERRSRIIAAAHDLISEIGVDAMSMKQLAERADVSLSTVYNLFESKEAVLARVFGGVFAEYRDVVFERAAKEPLQRFFDAIDIAAEFYEADVAFYRSMVWLVGRESQLKLAIQEPRFQFYCDLVQDAIDAGLLSPQTDSRLVGTTIVPLYSFAYQTWAAGAASIDEFCIRAKFGVVVVLKAFAAPEAQPRLDQHLAALETWLKAQDALRRKRGRRQPEPLETGDEERARRTSDAAVD